MNYNSNLQTNNTNLQSILDTINALPEAGTDLPELTNPANASEVFLGKEVINQDGDTVTGTFTIDNEVNTQEDLLAELQTILAGKTAAPQEPILQDKTVTPTTSSQTILPDSGFDGLSSVTVSAMPTATQATPSISVNASGLITASSTQTAGYVASGTKSATKQLTTQGAQTITPTTNDQTIASGKYLTGTQTIKGDANLVADNIKSGVSIFGVAGSYEGSGGGELQCVTGTMTMSSTGTTVTGLEFTPKFVLAHMSGDLSPARLSYGVKAPYVVCGGLYTRAIAYNNTGQLIANSSTSYATLTIVDNGFTIGTGTGTFSGTFGDGDTWSYVAVG